MKHMCPEQKQRCLRICDPNHHREEKCSNIAESAAADTAAETRWFRGRVNSERADKMSCWVFAGVSRRITQIQLFGPSPICLPVWTSMRRKLLTLNCQSRKDRFVSAKILGLDDLMTGCLWPLLSVNNYSVNNYIITLFYFTSLGWFVDASQSGFWDFTSETRRGSVYKSSGVKNNPLSSLKVFFYTCY